MILFTAWFKWSHHGSGDNGASNDMQLSLHQHNAAGLQNNRPHKALQDGFDDRLGAQLEGGLGGAQQHRGGGQAGCKCPLQIYDAQLHAAIQGISIQRLAIAKARVCH